MSASASTTTRLLRLLSLLQTQRDWPGTLLAQRLEISHRTVRRDVDRLREMGYNIRATMGPDGGYRLDAGNRLPPLLFDDDQAIAIAIALQSVMSIGVGIEEGAIRALLTMRQVLPPHLRHRLDALRVTAIASPPGGTSPSNVTPEVLLALSTAISAREIVRFDYAPRSPTSENHLRPPRRVEPLHIATLRGRWYVLAWDLDREDWRLFSVDRISPRTPTGPRFTPREVPGGDIAEFVSARFKGSDLNEWPCVGTVILELPAHEVLPFAGDGKVRDLGPNRCSLELGSWSWGSLAASFGRFEVSMQVVGQPELSRACAELSERFANVSSG